MGKKVETVKHKVFGGWAFYPITYKNKKYVITIKRGTSTWSDYKVNIFEYKKNETFFRKHKGKRLFLLHMELFLFLKNVERKEGIFF